MFNEYTGRKLISELDGQQFPTEPDHFIPKDDMIITVYDFNETGNYRVFVCVSYLRSMGVVLLDLQRTT